MLHGEPTDHPSGAYMDIIRQLIYKCGAYMDRIEALMDTLDAYKYHS